MNERYERKHRNRYIYIIAKTVAVITFVIVNMIKISILNLLVWILIVAVCSYFLYYEENNKAIRRLIESEVLALCISTCESLGVIFLQWLLLLSHVEIQDTIILYCLEVTFSKIIVIFLYYMIINRFMQKIHATPSKIQYSIYVIILVYSLINMLLIVGEFVQRKTDYLWAVNMGCIVLADLYLLYFIKMSNDKNYYESQVKELEQQAEVQYKFYCQQTEKYDSTLRILHDVNKHIKSIEALYAGEQRELATDYVKQINDMLKPLTPKRYTGNPILDILLTDKAIYMKEKGIDFQASLDNVDLNRIEPIDVTTIFGNLLDNAIEASEESNGKKYVHIKIGAYRHMIAIKIENNSNYVKWKNDMPVSEKGKNRGIGILNVQRSISKYDGDITLKWESNKFIAELFLNV